MGVVLRAIFVVSLLYATAAADLISPDQEQCSSKQAGDECGDTGVCETQKCSRARPGSNGAEIYEFDCMRCVANRRSSSRMPIYAGIAIGVLALAGGVYFAKRKKAA